MGVDYVSRAEWGARDRLSYTAAAPSAIKAHWEGTSMWGGEVRPHDTACAHMVWAIQAYHMDHNGWSDIAYSWLVCPHGIIFEGRGWDVRCAANGNEVLNATAYAVCYMGGEGDPFTAEGRVGLDIVMRESAAHGAGRRSYHSADYPTACPGGDIKQWVLDGCPIDAGVSSQEDDMASADIDAINARLDALVAQVAAKTRQRILILKERQAVNPDGSSVWYTDGVRAKAVYASEDGGLTCVWLTDYPEATERYEVWTHWLADDFEVIGTIDDPLGFTHLPDVVGVDPREAK